MSDSGLASADESFLPSLGNSVRAKRFCGRLWRDEHECNQTRRRSGRRFGIGVVGCRLGGEDRCVLGRPLHIATVVHIPAFYYSEPYLAESFKDELRRTATARLDSAQILARQSIDDDLEIVTELLDGSVSDRLIELSKGAYIIALGPRGHGEFTGLVVGSATVSVVSHGESPVAVVRGRTLDGRPPTEGPVVVGVDGSESSIEQSSTLSSRPPRGAPP